MDDLISVIVPVYNVEGYLCECVDSILAQTYKNLEIILIDDGSTDNSSRICDDYKISNSNVIVIHKSNGGADSARKAGIKIANGKYIGYVDADDWIEPKMFEMLHKYMVDNNVKVVESGIIDTNGDSHSFRYPSFTEGKYTDEKFEKEIEPYMLYSGKFYRLGIMASLCNKLFERTILTQYQMLPDPSDNIVDDTMVSIPCVAESKSIYITHDCFYHYRVRNNSVKHTTRPDFAEKIYKSYSDWNSRFKFAKRESNIGYQINMYLMYILLSKCPGIFDEPNSDTALTAYGEIPKTSRVIVHGAGAAGVQLADYVSKVFGSNFVLWTDKNYINLSKTLNVSDPKQILFKEYDFVLIGILWHERAESAIKDMIDMGVPREKILWIDSRYMKSPDLLLNKSIYNNLLTSE